MSRRASTSIPFAIATLGIATFSLMDVLMKDLSINLGAYNAMLWRLGAGFVIAGAIFLIRRSPWPARSTFRLHVLRGVLAAFMATAFFWGLARVPLAEAIALSFIAPLITLYLAAVILGEKIGRTAILASVLGLIGVGVILSGRVGGSYRPDVIQGIAAIFVSAMLYAYNLILQRQQAQIASPVEIAFFQNMTSGCDDAAGRAVAGGGSCDGTCPGLAGFRRSRDRFADAAVMGLCAGGGAGAGAGRIYRLRLGCDLRLVLLR